MRASLPAPYAFAAMLGAYTIEAYVPRGARLDTGQLTVDRSFTNLLGGTIVVGPAFTLNVEGGGFASTHRAQCAQAHPVGTVSLPPTKGGDLRPVAGASKRPGEPKPGPPTSG